MPDEERRPTCGSDITEAITATQYAAIDTFAGPGGLSLGLRNAGFRVVVAFDVDEQAVETYRHNLGPHCISADVRDVSGECLLETAKLSKGSLPLLAGGPPCQGFSKQKRAAHLGDTRNDLILEYIRLVTEIEPRFFLFENVAVFGQKRGKKYLETMYHDLPLYDLYPHFYNSADYGLAQTRERFILIGRRKDQNGTFQIPLPTVTEWKTVGEALAVLPEPPEDYTTHRAYLNHQRARVTAINTARFSHVPQGGGWRDIPEDLRLDCHREVNPRSGGWPDVYGRLVWNGQCPTITGGFDSFTRGRYGHPFQDRPLTPREAARLQGFPDCFAFLGTRADVRSQIGNAVPPPLAEAVAREVLRSLLCADGLVRDRGTEPARQGRLRFAFG